LKSLPFQQCLESLADQVMIISEQEANGHGIGESLEISLIPGNRVVSSIFLR
jgi:hypothetical protein